MVRNRNTPPPQPGKSGGVGDLHGTEERCTCGNLLARWTPQGIEIKCRRCKRRVYLQPSGRSRDPPDGSTTISVEARGRTPRARSLTPAQVVRCTGFVPERPTSEGPRNDNGRHGGHDMIGRFQAFISGAIVALLAFGAVGARADIIVIGGDAGTIYDGILDGFPFPPPGVAQDGNPDFLGNALGIALQTGVTEERGIGEFSLDDLAGLVSADIVSATLSFDIDDVVTTFGPGTSFDGTAAETIVLFSYAGNGVIELADFNNVAGAPLSVVDTTPLGVIDDASLATSGPLLFEVDVTAALGALLDASQTDMGIVWTTNDDLSATSLDNLGDGGAGPPGVNGATMPFITIVTVSSEPPVFNNDQLKCQKVIGKEAGKFAKTKQKLLTSCLDRVLKAVSKGQDLTSAMAKCVADLNEGDPGSKLGKAIAKLEEKVSGLCSGLAPADINSPCNAGATTFADVASCIADHHETKVEEMVAAEYANACEVITAVGLDTSFPTLCTAGP